MNETLQVIRQRRSIRRFQDAPVPDEITEAVLEAGRLAPCAMNRQRRHFTIIRSREILADVNREAKAVAASLKDRHLSLMAQSENYNIFHHAPLVIVVSGPDDESMVESDCAAAIQNMAIAAESLAYGSCWVNMLLFLFDGPKDAEYRKKLGIPEGYRPYGSLVIGLMEDGPASERAIRGNTVNHIG
jgi:nitroreductase